MSREVILKIGGETVVPRSQEDLPISLVYSIEGIEDPSKIGGSYAKRNITAAGIKRTIEVFGRAGDPATVDAVLEELPATVEVGGLPVFRGSAKLVESDRRGVGFLHETIINRLHL